MVSCLMDFLDKVIYLLLSFGTLHHQHLAFLHVWDILLTIVISKHCVWGGNGEIQMHP